jgi:hexosaminidase
MKMKLLLLSLTCCVYCASFSQYAIIPIPSAYDLLDANFTIDSDTKIFYSGPCGQEAALLGDLISSLTGKKTVVSGMAPDQSAGYIFLQCRTLNKQGNPIPDLPGDLEQRIARQPKGAYQMKILSQQVIVQADEPSGIFYGIMTLKQMLLQCKTNDLFSKRFELKCATIKDQPAFAHRGLLLDCCRHFFTKDFILKYIDLLALYKMNVLHWHLTEDQGWRIEIDKYPALTKIGAWRKQADGTIYGGFYSKNDIREIVAYAAKHHITVIPEIEMPGHSVAALAAYPQLGCTGEQIEVENEWGVFKDIYCAGNDETFQFLTDVLSEVCELFPSPYIHIGGDEAPKFRWEHCAKCQKRMQDEGLKSEAELQTYFIERIADFLTTKGKKIIGWDEILEGGIPGDAWIQSWRGMEGGEQAAKAGHGVVMSPTSHCYFDYGLESTDLLEVYAFDPVPAGLSQQERTNIRGGECNIWSEHAPQELVDSKVFPRLLAMSEVLWSYPAQRDYPGFYHRVEAHYPLLDSLQVNYGYPQIPVRIEQALHADGKIHIRLKPAFEGVELMSAIQSGDSQSDSSGHFTNADKYTITGKTQLLVRPLFRGKEYPAAISRYYEPHIAMGKKIQLGYEPSPYYPAGGASALCDGFMGSGNFRDGFWQGLFGKDMVAVIDLGAEQKIQTISSNFFHYVNAWIFRPRLVEFEISNDGTNWELLGSVKPIIDEQQNGELFTPITLNFSARNARYIRMKAFNNGPCPEWHDAPGEPSWLFCDEIMVK